MEFISTYGWAILIIVFMFLALLYFGVFSPSSILRERCDFGSGFSCEDFSISYATSGKDGEVKFKLRNRLKEDIFVENIDISTESVEPYECDINDDGIKWEVRGSKDFLSTKNCNSENAQFSEGKKGKVLVKLEYHYVGAPGFTHETYGEIYATVRKSEQIAPLGIEECNDGLDNDANGCLDYFGGDTGCSSELDTTENGGGCPNIGHESDPLYCFISTLCQDTILLKINNLNDAHAELSIMSNYDYKVCCKSATTTLSDSCLNPDFVVLRLHNNTDAHAEKNSLSNYNFDVCLSASSGNVNCQYRLDCEIGEACIASISDNTDAHLGDCITEPFNEKICCKII